MQSGAILALVIYVCMKMPRGQAGNNLHPRLGLLCQECCIRDPSIRLSWINVRKPDGVQVYGSCSASGWSYVWIVSDLVNLT